MAMYLGGQAVKIIERSKNLIPFPYEDTATQDGGVSMGVTYTIKDDGTIILNGTSTASRFYVLKKRLPLEEGKTYTISGSYGSQGYSYWRVYCEMYTADRTHLGNALSTNGTSTFTAPTGVAHCDIYLYTGSGVTLNNQVFKPMLNEGKPAPYGKKDSNIYFSIRTGMNMGRTPKNLIPFPYDYNAGTVKGVTYTIDDDGVVILNGAPTDGYAFALNRNIPMVGGKTYTLSGSYGASVYTMWRVLIELYNADGARVQMYNCTDRAITFTTPNETAYAKAYIVSHLGVTLNNQVFKPMLNEGTKALPYYYYD